MKYEMPVYIFMVAWGLLVKKQNFLLKTLLFVFVAAWILFSWLRG